MKIQTIFKFYQIFKNSAFGQLIYILNYIKNFYNIYIDTFRIKFPNGDLNYFDLLEILLIYVSSILNYLNIFL